MSRSPNMRIIFEIIRMNLWVFHAITNSSLYDELYTRVNTQRNRKKATIRWIYFIFIILSQNPIENAIQRMNELNNKEIFWNAHHHSLGFYMIWNWKAFQQWNFSDTDKCWSWSENGKRERKTRVCMSIDKIYIAIYSSENHKIRGKLVMSVICIPQCAWYEEKKPSTRSSVYFEIIKIYGRAQKQKSHFQADAFMKINIASMVCAWDRFYVRM